MKIGRTGLVHVYTGDGKGKTTAAVGLGIRAVGAGLKVIMIQFLKYQPTSEIKVLDELKPQFICIRAGNKNRGYYWTLDEAEKEEVKKENRDILALAEKLCRSDECNVLIMDEIMPAISNQIVSADEVLKIIECKRPDLELILTGRGAPEEIIKCADLVTEMKNVKHYLEKGIKAREGIDK